MTQATGSAGAAPAATGGIVLEEAITENRRASVKAGDGATVPDSGAVATVAAPLAVNARTAQVHFRSEFLHYPPPLVHARDGENIHAHGPVAANSTGNKAVADHALFKRRRAAVLTKNCTAVTVTDGVLSSLGERQRAGVIRMCLIRKRIVNSVTTGYTDRTRRYAVDDGKSTHHGCRLLPAMELEGALRIVFRPLAVDYGPFYDVRIIRIDGPQSDTLAAKINTVRVGYVVRSLANDNLIAAPGHTHSPLDRRILFRDLQNAAENRLELNRHNSVAVHRHVDIVAIPARLVNRVEIPPYLIIQGRPRRDSVTGVGCGN